MKRPHLEAIAKRVAENQQLSFDESHHSNFPRDFTPNPGGQEAFFDAIGLHSSTANYEGRFLYLRGGVGAGKTMCGSAFICLRAKQDPTAASLITANTYGQLEASTIPGFVEFCWRHNIKIFPSRENVKETAKAITARRLCSITILTPGKTYKTSIIVLSAEAFTARTADARTPGAGLQVRSIWADEFSTAKKSAFDVINDRLGRGEGSIKGLGVITSTINKYAPYNWTYDLFDAPDRGIEKEALFQSIVVRTIENITLDEEYYGSVAASLTEEHRRIQLESEYAAVSEGRLISTFLRILHIIPAVPLDRNEPVHLAFDFNRSPATGTAWQVIDGKIFGIREWYQLNSDTFALGQSVADWLIESGHQGKIYIYGDASGGQRTANSRNTNWQIVRDNLTKVGLRFIMRVPRANPSIVDSVNGLKVVFQLDKVFVSDSQKELIKDLESVMWDEKQKGQINKSDPLRTHLLDGLRYMIWVLHPYKKLNRVLTPEQTKARGDKVRPFDRIY